MQKYIETIINALKFWVEQWVKHWVRHDAFTADDAMEALIENDVVEPLRAADGTIYTDKNGDIYVL